MSINNIYEYTPQPGIPADPGKKTSTKTPLGHIKWGSKPKTHTTSMGVKFVRERDVTSTSKVGQSNFQQKIASLKESVAQTFEKIKTSLSELNDKIEDRYQKSNLKKFNDQIATAFRNLNNYLDKDNLTGQEIKTGFKKFFKDIGKAFSLLFSKTSEETLSTMQTQIENGHYGDAFKTLEQETSNALTAWRNRIQG